MPSKKKETIMANLKVAIRFFPFLLFSLQFKVSFADFQKYLDTTNPDSKVNFFEQIYPNLKHYAYVLICSMYGKIFENKINHCFEVIDFFLEK